MPFSNNAPGALVRCIHCERLFPEPVNHDCPDAPEEEEEIEIIDDRPEDDVVLVFDWGSTYHELGEDDTPLCGVRGNNEPSKAKRKEIKQEDDLEPCSYCAGITDVDLKE